MPPGTKLNKLGEFTDLAIDLGTVISARSQFVYDRERWLSNEPLVQPTPAEQEVIVEYAAHPQAKLYVATAAEQTIVYDLATLTSADLIEVAPAHRPVRVRVVEQGTTQPVAVRIHFHGQHGEYYRTATTARSTPIGLKITMGNLSTSITSMPIFTVSVRSTCRWAKCLSR